MALDWSKLTHNQIKHYADMLNQENKLTAAFFSKQQETTYMSLNKILFTVYTAANGYYAVSDSGITVVSTTLSGVCTDMQAVLADEAVRSNVSSVAEVGTAAWEKIK